MDDAAKSIDWEFFLDVLLVGKLIFISPLEGVAMKFVVHGVLSLWAGLLY